LGAELGRWGFGSNQKSKNDEGSPVVEKARDLLSLLITFEGKRPVGEKSGKAGALKRTSKDALGGRENNLFFLRGPLQRGKKNGRGYDRSARGLPAFLFIVGWGGKPLFGVGKWNRPWEKLIV